MLRKLQVLALYLLILTLPFNLRHIFNFDTIKEIDGFREHLTFSLYLFDLPLLFLLLTSLIHKIKRRNSHPPRKKTHIYDLPIFYFLLFIIITFPFTYRDPHNFYNLIRLLGAIALFLTSRNLFRQYTVLTYSQLLLFIDGVLQSYIAIGQFIQQKSLGLFFLGESVINNNLPGIARFTFEGEKLIRAYGTFPHPNILGIFLLLSLSAGLNLIISKKDLLNKLHWPYRLIIISFFISIFIGILLTYSRAVISFTGLLLLFFAFTQKKFIRQVYRTLCRQLKIPSFLQTGLAIILILGGLFTSYNLIAPRLCWQCTGDRSISFRKIYQQTAKHIILQHPFTGVGLGNFVATSQNINQPAVTPWRLQPVHNLYLLIASELGILGMLLFLLIVLYYISPQLRRQHLKNSPLDLFFIFCLIIAFFDHYFWTTPQGQLIFWLSLALASVPKSKKTDSPKYHFKIIIQNVRYLIKELS